MLVCVVWVGGSFLVESLEAAGLSPLLLTYVCNALFVVLLPVYYARRRVLGKTTPETAGGDDAARDGAESRESRFAPRGRGDASGKLPGAETFAYEQPVSGEDEADDYGTALLDVPEGGDVRTEHGDVEGDALGEGFDAAAARRRPGRHRVSRAALAARRRSRGTPRRSASSTRRARRWASRLYGSPRSWRSTTRFCTRR